MTIIIKLSKKEIDKYVKRIKECKTDEELRIQIRGIHVDGCIDGCLIEEQ